MSNHIRWGVLGVARIATRQVIPAMQRGQHCVVEAIASRELGRAQHAAKQLGIPLAFGSYDTLLADDRIDAVYIALPNHLHVPWSVRALEAGKHVLCEKPLGLNAAEAVSLQAESRRHPDLKVMEAFMYRFHPQWEFTRDRVADGSIGPLRAIQTFFSYTNLDAGDIRNRADIGGGALMDIGCYPISLSRWLFASEPARVLAATDIDPVFGIDRLTTAVLEFSQGTSAFTCGTQLAWQQRVTIVGTTGRIEIEIPFNPPIDRPCRLWLQRDSETTEQRFDVCSHYTLQGDSFSRSILDDAPVPTPLDDAVANMRAIDAMFASANAHAAITMQPT